MMVLDVTLTSIYGIKSPVPNAPIALSGKLFAKNVHRDRQEHVSKELFSRGSFHVPVNSTVAVGGSDRISLATDPEDEGAMGDHMALGGRLGLSVGGGFLGFYEQYLLIPTYVVRTENGQFPLRVATEDDAVAVQVNFQLAIAHYA